MGGRLDARQNGRVVAVADDVGWDEERGSRPVRAVAEEPAIEYAERLRPGAKLGAIDAPERRLQAGRVLGALRVGESRGSEAIERGSAPGVRVCARVGRRESDL